MAAIWFSLISAAVPTSANTPVSILPLGDSITEGSYYAITYRRDLWHLLDQAGYDFDFVGNKQTDSSNYHASWELDFDTDHEGHYGWTTDQVNAQLVGWLTNYTPDIVLLHLGTNDTYYGETAVEAIGDIAQTVSMLRADNPQVIIFLAQIIPMMDTGDPNESTDVTAYNAAIAQFASANSTQNSPIIVVDHFTGYDPATLNEDIWHPNTDGEAFMANQWFAALQPVLDSLSSPESPEVNIPVPAAAFWVLAASVLIVGYGGIRRKVKNK